MLKTLFSSFHTVMGSSLSHSQQSAVDTVNQWRSRPRHELIFDSGRREISQYLLAVDKLQVSNAGGSNEKLISTAMERLKAEFEAVLRRHADLQPGPVSTTEWSSVSDSTANAFRYEDYVPADAMNDDVIDFLRNIAQRMRSRGKIDECVRVYKNVRKPYLQSQLKRLRFDELRGDHNQRRYVHDEVKLKMEQWIQVSKICVKILFDREKKVCDQIFGSGADVTEDCFVGTVKDSAVLLFRFAEDLSSTRQPYQKMGAVLGVYEAFLWVLPSAEALFASVQGKGVRDVCEQAYSRIQADALRMLYDLEHDVLHEKVDNAVSEGRGGVHPTTEFVMEQIDVIARNKNLLMKLIASPPSLNFGDAAIPQEDLRRYSNDNAGFLEQHLVLIILILLRNLEMKARAYKLDPSLGHLFVMINLRCVLRAVEGSDEVREMLGARLIGKMSEQLGAARASYQTTTCDKFLKCLRDDGIYRTPCCFNSRPSKAAIKRRLNEFNAVFEGVKDLHSSWKIPDNQLREEVRSYMCDALVPHYRTFLDKFGNNPETKPTVEGSKKHSAEDLQVLVKTKLFANGDF